MHHLHLHLRPRAEGGMEEEGGGGRNPVLPLLLLPAAALEEEGMEEEGEGGGFNFTSQLSAPSPCSFTQPAPRAPGGSRPGITPPACF